MTKTKELQELLDKGGYVFIPSGEYVIEEPLIIHSNTHLQLAPDTILRLPDDGVFSLIENDGLKGEHENHNIRIEGGVWDGTNLQCERKFLAPGESYTDGGTFNKERYFRNDYLGLLMRFVHCRNLYIGNLTVKDPLSFGMQLADTVEFTVENIHLNYNCKKRNMDGVHITGPARFGCIRNIHGIANDDQVALTADATPSPKLRVARLKTYLLTAYTVKTPIPVLGCSPAVILYATLPFAIYTALADTTRFPLPTITNIRGHHH